MTPRWALELLTPGRGCDATRPESGAAAMELAAFAHMLDHHPPSLVITNVGAVTEPDSPDRLLLLLRPVPRLRTLLSEV